MFSPLTKTLLSSFAFVFLLTAGCASLQQYSLGDVLGDAPLDEQTVVAGLKEALQVGSGRAIATTSALDGFLANELIRIALPADVQPVAKVMRDVGLGGQVDNFEVSMNRAAEQATGEAQDIFWNAITSMSIADAFGILNGHETAATEYFQGRTSDTLRQRFRPVVDTKMREVGVYQVYEDLVDRTAILPVNMPDLDLVEYITEKSLSGLFSTLAGEEKKIREDPVARTTELLRRVFGRDG
ncbi:MAG: DUF4197 domain-containing protein [bacterium]